MYKKISDQSLLSSSKEFSLLKLEKEPVLETQNSEREENSLNFKLYKHSQNDTSVSSTHKKSTTEQLQNSPFKGYSNLFKPKMENVPCIEKVIDNLILNPYKLGGSESKEEVMQKLSDMKDFIAEYWENPMPSLINKPFYTDIFPNKPNAKSRHSATTPGPNSSLKSQQNENTESTSEKAKSSIAAITLSKSGILAYAENGEKNHENFVTIIRSLEDSRSSNKERTSHEPKESKISNLLISKDEKHLLVTQDTCIFFYNLVTMTETLEKIDLNSKEYGLSKADGRILSIMEWTDYDGVDGIFLWLANGKAYFFQDYKKAPNLKKITPVSKSKEACLVTNEQWIQ